MNKENNTFFSLREELSKVTNQLIPLLFERSKYACSPEKYKGDYLSLLKIICSKDNNTECPEKLDSEIIKLLGRRNELVIPIIKYKLEHDIPIHDEERTKEVIDGAVKVAKEIGWDTGAAKKAVEFLVRVSEEIQKKYLKEKNR